MAETITSPTVSVVVAGQTYVFTLVLAAQTSNMTAAGGSNTITATLTSSPAGADLSGVVVTFNVDSLTTGVSNIGSGTATTDSGGIASAVFTFPSNTSETVQDEYGIIGTATPVAGGPSTGSSEIYVYVGVETWALGLAASATSEPATGGSVTLTATLSNNSGQSLSGYTVTFLEAGGTSTTGTTNSSGVATGAFVLGANDSTTAVTYSFTAQVTA